MNKFILSLFSACLFTFFTYLPVHAKNPEEIKKARMCSDLDSIKNTLEIKYAPLDLKKVLFNWSLDEIVHQAKNEIDAQEDITIKQFQQILRKFFGAIHDLHVHVEFCSTEIAFLPFTVKGINGRYFVEKVDAQCLSTDLFNIKRGDEIIEFDGKPVEQVICELKQAAGWTNQCETEQALAEMNLTMRSGKAGHAVPRGPVSIKTQSLDGSSHSYQLIWDYSPELIKNSHDIRLEAANPVRKLLEKNFSEEPSLNMISPLYAFYDFPILEKAGGFGARRSKFPLFGTKIWRSSFNSPFYAYIYENDEKKHIGYVRIPRFTGYAEDIKAFAELIQLFENKTDALVIDQTDNPGGNVFFCYTIASFLTNQPLTTPKHHLKLTHIDIQNALKELSTLNQIKSNEDVDRFYTNHPYMNYQFALFFKEFYRFMISEWNAGRIFTNATHLGGMDQINPNPSYQYTKPILILINELDMSCADFFPAIMQDNKRALLFGTKTGGAGGCVVSTSFQNRHGIAQYSYTHTLAERSNCQLIENNGVKPDIDYQLTIEDLQNNYASYISAVNKAVNELIQNTNTK